MRAGRKLLGKKHMVSHEEFLRVYEIAKQLVSKEEIDRLIDQTAEEIKKVIKGKKAAIAWSGGKDSLALEFVANVAGVKEGVWVRTKDLQYPEQLRYSQLHKSPYIQEWVTHHDMEWLSRNQHLLFPKDASITNRWSQIVQRDHQNLYVKREKVDVLMLGRRKKDGNFVTNNKQHAKDGTIRYSPLADWTHEEVLALFKHYSIPLPVSYTWKDGFHQGTMWAARERKGKTVEDMWQEIYEIDPSIVYEAERWIPSAASFLQTRGLK